MVPDIATRRIHLCGPDEMMAAVKGMLRDLGVSEDQIHVESFVRNRQPEAESVMEVAARFKPSARVAEASGAVPTPSITFARAGKSKAMSIDQTVLEAAEELGVGIPYDCRAGICGQCKTRLLEGNVAMDADDALDAADRAAGLILTCQARCLDAVVLEA